MNRIAPHFVTGTHPYFILSSDMYIYGRRPGGEAGGVGEGLKGTVGGMFDHVDVDIGPS